jgi:hypothetical protein
MFALTRWRAQPFVDLLRPRRARPPRLDGSGVPRRRSEVLLGDRLEHRYVRRDPIQWDAVVRQATRIERAAAMRFGGGEQQRPLLRMPGAVTIA